MNLLTTQQAAERLGISQPRIYQLIGEGRLPAQKLGRDYVIDEKDLKLVENRPSPGRPPKAKTEKHPEGDSSKRGKQ